MTQVFISYSRKDLAFVERLISDIKKTEVDVWYDLSGLEGGARWRNEIQNAIKNSDYVIVVLSPDSVESEWVEREHLYSENLDKKILPIMYRECELPLSFLNLNYVDVQGENYARNFDKIKRFLNAEPLTSSSMEGTPPGRGVGVSPRLLWGGVAVLGAALLLYLFNAGQAKGIPDLNNANTPVQAQIQPTDIPGSDASPDLETSTPAQPVSTMTGTPPPATGVSMLPSVPAVVDTASQAVFSMSAASGNMTGHVTTIDHPLANDPNALVFITSTWGPREVYNNHLVGVWFTGTQWAILNQDMGFMPQDASFNVQILGANGNSFIHTATSSNTSGTRTTLDNPLASDPDALVFAVSNWSPPDGSRKPNIHPIGVTYMEGRWAIFNQDSAAMREGAAFNVLIINPGSNAFIHTASSANTTGHSTDIEDPFARDPNKLVFVMPRSLPADGGEESGHPIGVWYTGRQWAVFNQDFADIPEGAEFNILMLDAN